MSVLYRALRRLSEEEDKARPDDELSEILAEPPPPRRRLIRPGFAAGALVLMAAAVFIGERAATIVSPSVPAAPAPPAAPPKPVVAAAPVAALPAPPPAAAAPVVAAAPPAAPPPAPIAAKKPPIVVAQAEPTPSEAKVPETKVVPETKLPEARVAAAPGRAEAASGDDTPPASKPLPARAQAAAAASVAAPPAANGATARGRAAMARLAAADTDSDEDFTPSARPPARSRAGATPPPGAQIEIHRDDEATRDGIQKGYGLLLRGDYPGALAAYQAVLAGHRDNVEGAVGVAVALHKMQRLDEAGKAYRRVLDLDPGNVNALGGILSILAQTAPASALPQLLDLAHEHPYDSPLLAQLGSAYAETGATDSALRWMREAVRISPDNPYYRLNLAVLLDRSNNTDEAAAEYQNYLRLVTMSGDIAANRDEIARVNTRLNYLRAASLKP